MSHSPPHHEEPPEATSQHSTASSPTSIEGSGRPQPFIVRLNPGVDNPYGFRIYRTTYDSDQDWDQFMAYFKAQARRSMVQNELGEYAHLANDVDFTVQSSPDLADITISEVRT